MNIALIEPVGGHGGMNYYDMSLARGLAAEGVSVTWYTCDKTMEADEEGVVVRKTFKGVYGSANKILRLFRFIYGLLVSLVSVRRSGGKVVHYHFFGMGPLESSMCLLARLFACRVVATIHDVESFAGLEGSVFSRLMFAAINQFIVHNKSSRKALLDVAPEGFNQNTISIIHHGNYAGSVKRLDMTTSRRALGLPEDGELVLFFGQIKEVKGLDLLLTAIPKVVKKMGNVTFLIAGKVWKDDFSRYQLIIDQLNLAPFVRTHIRYIPDEDVDIYYSAADVVALPYRKIYQSGVLLMAMSYGLPVVASDLLGMSEVVNHKMNGYLFKRNDADALAQALVDALADVKQRALVGEAARLLMETDYSWESAAEKTKAVYERLV